MGWDAPGHVPWENTLEHPTRKWLPEGSLFSSESFSRALFHARNCRAGIGSDSSLPDDIKLVDLNSEMLEMMRELHSLRSYFAETLQDDSDLDFDLDSSHKPPVPALVVSTSYMTFPLTSPESSQNISQDSTSAIASRRGRKALLPLTIQKHNIPPTRPHPDTGCHVPDKFDIHAAVITGAENPEKSTLRVEEMISNLRFQCSNMLPSPSPPVADTSWNSRSPLPLASDNEAEKPNHAKKTSAISSLEPCRNTAPSSVPIPSIRHSESRLKGKLNQPKFIYKKRTTSDLPGSQLSLSRKSNKVSSAQNVIPTPTRVVVQKIPRSAMAKGINNRSQKPYKVVRFALPRSEVAKDLGFSHKSSFMRQPLPTSNNRDDPDSKIILLPDDMPNTVPLCPPIHMNSIPVRKDNGPVRTPGSSPLRHLKMRTRSVSITPFSKISLRRASVELRAPTSESGSTTQGRRSHSLGAHSLSRIIRGPMLALKENKRATISIDSTAFNTNYTDDKRRMSADTVPGNSKKNRMPIHFKSLLTRFK
jgi:hypothetical protein